MPRPRPRGFTLLELLLAASLAVVLVAAVLMIATRGTDLWERSAGRAESTNAGQRILDQVERDLQCAGPVEPSDVWLTVRLGEPPGEPSIRLGGVAVGADRFGPGTLVLRMVTRSEVLGPQGETPLPVVVSYRIAQLPIGSGGAPRSVLCRVETKPGDAFKDGFDLSAAQYADAADATEPADAGDLASALGWVIGSGVVDFGLRIVAGNQLVFPVGSDAREIPLQGRRQRQRPLEVELMIRVLTLQGSTAVGALTPGRSAADWWRAVESGSVVITRRVMIVGAGA